MKKDPYEERGTSRFCVKRDDVEHFWSNKYNACLSWLQGHVPYSWDHAMKHEGWKIEDKENTQ